MVSVLGDRKLMLAWKKLCSCDGGHYHLVARCRAIFLEASAPRVQEDRLMRRKRGWHISFEIEMEGGIFLLFLFLSFQHIFKWEGDVGFCICVCHSDIKDGVSLALPQMTYLEILAEAWYLLWCGVDSDFIWLSSSCYIPNWVDQCFI